MASSMNLSASEVSGSVNIAKNTSDIKVKLTITTTGESHNETGDTTGSITINGTSYSLNGKTFGTNKTTTIFENTITIAHSTDGSKTVVISYSFNTKISAGTITGSKSVTLTKIARASSITCTTSNIGSDATISISRASSSFTHSLYYKMSTSDSLHWIKDKDGNNADKITDTSFAWRIPTDFYNSIPNKKYISGILVCKTFSGSTQIGSDTSITFVANVDESINKPTINPVIYDCNDSMVEFTGDENKFIKIYSDAYYNLNITTKNSATVKSILITCGDLKGTTATGTLRGVQSGTFKITVTDSRGFSVSDTVTKTLIGYMNPTCTMTVSDISANGDVTLKFKGNCFNGNFGKISNVITLEYRYKEEGGNYTNADWIGVIPTFSGNTYTATVTLHNLNHQKAYTFQGSIYDRLYGLSTPEVTKSSIPVFDWGKDDFNFNVPVNINGGLNVNNNITFENGKQTDERSVRFKNTNGANTHNCTLYGGDPNSDTGVGLWDSKHDRRILSYLDNNNDLMLGNNSCYITSERRLRTLAVSAGAYMNASQTITLSDKVSNQLNGIVIAWSYYDGTSGVDYDWNYTFIPKEHVLRHEGKGVDCPIIWYSSSLGENFASKYLYVNDSSITGYAGNSSVTNNARFVLRYVYGV